MIRKKEHVKQLIIGNIGNHAYLRSSKILNNLKLEGISLDRSTLTRYLSEMENDNQILVNGSGAGRRYSTNDINARLSNQNRPIVHFSMGRLNYVSFFSEKQLLAIDDERVSNIGETYASDIMESMVIDLSFGSSALEGNTYSLLDTQALIEYGQELSSADRRDTIMILNHKNAIQHAISVSDITFFELGQIHSRLMDGLIHPKDCGLIRSDRVNIQGSKYSPPVGRELLTEAIEKIISELNIINHPVEKALYLMTVIPYAQPYADGNNRTGRLSMNIPLIHSGYPPMSFKNVDKSKYIVGMIAFYEFGERNLISKVFSDAYKGAGQEYISRFDILPIDESRGFLKPIRLQGMSGLPTFR